MSADDLHMAEVPYEDGTIRLRYSRYLTLDGSRWVRHGLYLAYHNNGKVKSEGYYAHGLEHGQWCDYHSNGRPAAKGRYQDGVEVGTWQFWSEDGTPEDDVVYD